MPVFTPSFRGCEARPWRGCRQWLAALGAALLLPACAQQPAPVTGTAAPARPAHDISLITLERSCFGCPGSTRLELRRDGTAVLSTTGNAKLGQADSVARARLPQPAFDELARQLLASGFFEMAASYQEAGLQDGSWATLAAVRGAQQHAVFRREEAGPAALQQLLDAVAAQQALLRLVPDTR